MSPSSPRRGAMLCGALTLSACATGKDVSPPPLVDISQRECAAAPDLSQATPLVFNAKKETPQSTAIDASTPCLKGPAGNSLYAVYLLPASEEPYVIDVASVPMGTTVLAPRAMLLGADGTLKRQFSGEAVTHRGNAFSILTRRHDDERYLVVASDAAGVGKSDTRISESTTVTTASTGMVTYQIHSGDEAKTTYNFAHNGKIVVSLTPLTPAK